MPDIGRYEMLVIGSGESGKQLTWALAQAVHRTAVVERKYIGGSPEQRTVVWFDLRRGRKSSQ